MSPISFIQISQKKKIIRNIYSISKFFFQLNTDYVLLNLISNIFFVDNITK
jgi:hypothetical protein